jgi:molybdate transport system regulatory protein
MSGSIENPEYQLEIGKKSIILDYKKFLLLKGIKDYGSIVKATQKIGLPYRTALKYIEILENQLGSKVVATQRGGAGGGGGSQLTSIGKMVIKEYSKLKSIMEKHLDVNEIEGRVENVDEKNRVMNVRINDIKIMLPIIEDLSHGDDVLLLISPEEIFIMLEPQESSVRNIFEGRIVEMKFKNEIVRLNVTIDDGISMKADITEYSRDKLDLNLGKKVFIGFKAASIPIIKI